MRDGSSEEDVMFERALVTLSPRGTSIWVGVLAFVFCGALVLSFL
jgi:hypothetical protein